MRTQAGIFRNVDKATTLARIVWIDRHIVIEHIGLPEAREEQVGITVVVDVAHGHSHAAAGVVESDLLGHVSESTAAQVFIQFGGWWRAMRGHECGPLYKEQIQQAILVVIKPSQARA